MVDGVWQDQQLELFGKAQGEEMTMEQFAGWLGESLGTGITGALQISALSLCADVIAQDISKATLRFREYLENGTSKIISPRRHAMAGFLAIEPNSRMTWGMFVEMMVYWSCFTDNAYAGIIRANDGTPLKLIPFQSGRVFEKVSGAEIFYEVTAGTMQEQALLGSGFRVFPERDMLHIRTRFLDGMDGYSTLTAGKETIEIMQNLSKYRSNLFGEEGQMRGVFTRDNMEPLPDELFQRVRQQFKILMNRFRQLTEPIILEGGVKFESISSNPNDMELTKQFEAQVNEVCRLFRMPPHKIFLMSGSKYENLETQEKMYVGDTLLPRAKRFEEMFAKMLLTNRERIRYFFQFDRSEMTLRDTKVETERTIKAVERGVIEIDEARAVLGYNPLMNGAGKVRLIPTNMTMVDDKNGVIVAGSSTADPNANDPSADPAADPNADTPPSSDTTDGTDTPSKSVGLRLIKR